MTVSCPLTEDRTAFESGQCKHQDLLRPGGIDLTARAIAFCRLSRGTRVLDVGCGSGEGTEYLYRMLELDAIGIDLSASACRSSRRRDSELAIVRADAAHLPFASASMDALIAECVLSLIKDKTGALAECNRVLKPGGRLVITDVYARDPDARKCLHSLRGTCVSGIMTRPEVNSVLAKHGFVIQVWEDHSDALRKLIARFLLQQGCLEQLWTSGSAKREEAQRISEALKVARPGYFLLVAAKDGAAVHRGEQS